MSWQSRLILQDISLLDIEVTLDYKHATVWVEFSINEKNFCTVLDIWADKTEEVVIGHLPLTYDIIADKIIEQVSTIRKECQNEKTQNN